MNNPVAAANQIGGEKTVETVTFPLTGDKELDTISGMMEVASALNLSARDRARVCRYLAERYDAYANATERLQGLSQGIPGPWATTPNITQPTMPYSSGSSSALPKGMLDAVSDGHSPARGFPGAFLEDLGRPTSGKPSAAIKSALSSSPAAKARP